MKLTITITKVENGYIVAGNVRTFICATLDEALVKAKELLQSNG